MAVSSSFCSNMSWLFTRSPLLEFFRFSRLPLLLAVLPPPFLDEVDELDRGEKDETLLALPKLVFKRQAASTFPVDPLKEPVWKPAKTGFLGMASDAGVFCCWLDPNELLWRDQEDALSSRSSSEPSWWSKSGWTLLSLSSESTGTETYLI